MAQSLRFQLGATFVAFLLLIGASVAACLFAIQNEVDNDILAEQAGHQRILIERIVRLTLTQPSSPKLQDAAALFDQTLLRMRGGHLLRSAESGEAVFLPGPDPTLHTRFDHILLSWERFRTRLPANDPPSVLSGSRELSRELDEFIGRLDSLCDVRRDILRQTQFAFLACALLLLGWSWWLGTRRILRPVSVLGAAARRMALGRFDVPVERLRGFEMNQLERAFEVMRIEMSTSRDLLEDRVARRTQQLVTAFEFSQEIVTRRDLDSLLQSVTDRTRLLMRAEAATLCLRSPETGLLRVVARSGQLVSARDAANGGQVPPEAGAEPSPSVEPSCAECALPKGCKGCAFVCIPLLENTREIGALCAVRNTGFGFDQAESQALTLLGNSAAIAIQNARLTEEARRDAERAAALAERERLAGELHDRLAQTLSFVGMKAERAEELMGQSRLAEAAGELGRVRSAVQSTWRELRAALADLHDTEPEASECTKDLTDCLEAFRRESGLTAELVLEDGTTPLLARATQVQAVRILREALSNVHRHAAAGRVRVRIALRDGMAEFEVEDDGRGFDASAVSSGSHLGLSIMRARAERVGGAFAVFSGPGHGSRIVARFPIVRSLPAASASHNGHPLAEHP